MDIPEKFICAALHLPPLPGSRQAESQSIGTIVDFALRNTEMAVNNGIRSLYIQDLGDHPVQKKIPAYIVGGMAIVAYAIRKEFPELKMGICFMGHGAKEPLAVAKSVAGDFVRLKVYVGAMVKAEGILEGCAVEAVEAQKSFGAEHVKLFVDIFDRTGVPLCPLPLVEECRQAAVFGNADALILTGKNFEETSTMIHEVRASDVQTPLFVGGGVNANNVAKVLKISDGFIVSSAFKGKNSFTKDTFSKDWDSETIRNFVSRIKESVEMS